MTRELLGDTHREFLGESSSRTPEELIGSYSGAYWQHPYEDPVWEVPWELLKISCSRGAYNSSPGAPKVLIIGTRFRSSF